MEVPLSPSVAAYKLVEELVAALALNVGQGTVVDAVFDDLVATDDLAQVKRVMVGLGVIAAGMARESAALVLALGEVLGESGRDFQEEGVAMLDRIHREGAETVGNLAADLVRAQVATQVRAGQ